MINWEQARKYCCENICLIENYDKASKDLLEVWDIHHRKEEEGYSRQELIEKGMYYERPASELIFLKRSEHLSLHMKGNKYLLGKTGEKNHRSKQILQIDKQTGQVIKIWPCVMEVERVLGINNGNISKCCKGKLKSCGGYIWKYADI